MKLLNRIVSRETLGTDVLRLVICAVTFTHGAYRLRRGEVSGLGSLLREQHVPAGMLAGYVIESAEVVGNVLLALRLMAVPLSLLMAFIYFNSIVLFGWHNGFFVVGPLANGGWEYTAVLVTAFLTTAWANRGTPFLPFRGRRASS